METAAISPIQVFLHVFERLDETRQVAFTDQALYPTQEVARKELVHQVQYFRVLRRWLTQVL